MDSEKQFATGLDIGTENIRAVIVSIGKDQDLSIVGYNEGKSIGMRKGMPANLTAPGGAIDKILGNAEQMGGYDVRSAYVSINGSSTLSSRTEGMIAFGAAEHEVEIADLERIEDIAISGLALKNREILDFVPLEYALDGQAGIKDPLGMAGAKLEMRGLVVSALSQTCNNLRKITASADVQALRLVPSAVAAAKAVLTERQKENGVAVIDMGAVTTSVAIYEENDLQYVGVVGAGSNNITNDLAIVLEIERELAEEIKERFITGDFEKEKTPVIRVGREGRDERVFERKEVEEVVQQRLAEIFGEIRKRIKLAKYDQRLPEGIILTGGGAKMRDIEKFAKQELEAAVKIGKPQGLGGVADAVEKPEFATAVGLAMLAAEEGQYVPKTGPVNKKSKLKPKGDSLIKKIFSKF